MYQWDKIKVIETDTEVAPVVVPPRRQRESVRQKKETGF